MLTHTGLETGTTVESDARIVNIDSGEGSWTVVRATGAIIDNNARGEIASRRDARTVGAVLEVCQPQLHEVHEAVADRYRRLARDW